MDIKITESYKIIDFKIFSIEKFYNDKNYNWILDKNNLEDIKISCKLFNDENNKIENFCIKNKDYLDQKSNILKLNNYENIKTETIYLKDNKIITISEYNKYSIQEFFLNAMLIWLIVFTIWFVLFPKKTKND